MEAIPEREKQLVQMELLRNVYRSTFRVVSVVSPGTVLGDLSLRDGTAVANAVYTGADGSGIFVTTEAGPRSVAKELLPDAVKSRFHFPPDFAESEVIFADLLAKKPAVLVSGDPVGMVAAVPAVGGMLHQRRQAEPQLLTRQPGPARRNQECRKTNWQFSCDDSRVKLKSLYPSFQN